MRKLIFVQAIVITVLTLSAMQSLAATSAWIISQKEAQKLNAANNIVDIKEFDGGYKQYYDKRTGNLFVLTNASRDVSVIFVYDIFTLKYKGKLNITISDSAKDELQIITPNKGNIFYVRFLENEDGEPQITSYDATTLSPIKKYTTTPGVADQSFVSESGNLLYSISNDENILRADVFNTADFSLKESIDLKANFTLGVEGAVSQLAEGKLLISEVITREPQLEYFLYIYDLATNKITPKIRTMIKGDDYLIPITSKILLHERQTNNRFKSMRLETDYKTTGKIHVFNGLNAQKICTATIGTGLNGKFITTAMTGNILYYVSYGEKFANPILNIIDINQCTSFKPLPLSTSEIQMIFYDEN